MDFEPGDCPTGSSMLGLEALLVILTKRAFARVIGSFFGVKTGSSGSLSSGGAWRGAPGRPS